MGQRLAPVLAICFMSKIEEPVLSRLPLMYCRYIDDCCIITSTQSEMDECFRLLNQQSEHIRFTREKPDDDGWLPYLNAQFRLSDRSLAIKWYRKDSSKNILINARSAHPSAVKRSVVRNMFKTALDMCTGSEEREQSRRLALNIARENGYALHTRQRRPRRINSGDSSNKIPLCLPFISDQVSAEIRQSIIRAQLSSDIILVNIPSGNIKKRLVRNRLYDNYCIMEN